MRRDRLIALACLIFCLAAAPALAQKGMPVTSILVGGQPMASDRDIMENLARSGDHHILVGLLQVAGLTELLHQHGPYTLFAPTDAAFAAFPTTTLESLRRVENRAALLRLLRTYLVPGDYSSARMRFLMRGTKAQTELDTLADSKLQVGFNGPSNIVVRSGATSVADIVVYDVKQANGVVFVIDRVLEPG